MAEQHVERRLAAVLAADVVGYSRLMAGDEEGTLARLNVLRRQFLEPTIAEHRGRIVKRNSSKNPRRLAYSAVQRACDTLKLVQTGTDQQGFFSAVSPCAYLLLIRL